MSFGIDLASPLSSDHLRTTPLQLNPKLHQCYYLSAVSEFY